MRLIGSLEDPSQAESFSHLLTQEKIPHRIEAHQENEKTVFWIWIISEDQIERATLALEEYREAPEIVAPRSSAPPPPPQTWRIRPPSAHRMRRSLFSLTGILILVCSLLFFYSSLQTAKIIRSNGLLAAKLALNPIQRAMLFDEPESLIEVAKIVSTNNLSGYDDTDALPLPLQREITAAENLPAWEGIYPLIVTHFTNEPFTQGPFMEEILSGELWRLFSPALMHGGLLHLLFNMLWLWVLGNPIEMRLKIPKMLLLIVVIGVISNFAQYLVTGPIFFGFSGVVCGMVGFIWMRQRHFPWEGYNIHPSIFTFIFFYIAALFVLQLVLFFLQIFQITDIHLPIANTGHITGGVVGLFLGRLPFLSPKTV